MPDDWDYSAPRRSQADWLSQAPIITALLAALCVLITLASFTQGVLHAPLWTAIGHIGDVAPEDIWSRHYAGLITSVFPHGGVLHIVFNMLWLVQLGRVLEATLRPWTYIAFLAAAAAVGTASEMLVSSTTGIGASGVVYAMMGLMWAGRGRYPAWRAVATNDNLRVFLLWGAFCIVTTSLHILGIANGAHVGGFLFGASVGWLFAAPRRQWLWAIVLAALLTANACALFWMPWSERWRDWKAGQDGDRAAQSRPLPGRPDPLAAPGIIRLVAVVEP